VDQLPVLTRPAEALAGLIGARAADALAALLLGAVAGYVDAVAYLTLHAFVANMTGTVVLVGVAAVSADARTALPGILALVGFLIGVVVSRRLGRLGRGAGLPLLASAAVLGTAAMASLHGTWTVVLLASAMGMQNAAATRFAGVGLNTAFLTGDLERLGEAVAEPAPSQEESRPRRLILIGAVLATYAAGAASGAVALRWLGRPLLGPTAVLIVAAAFAGRAADANGRA